MFGALLQSSFLPAPLAVSVTDICRSAAALMPERTSQVKSPKTEQRGPGTPAANGEVDGGEGRQSQEIPWRKHEEGTSHVHVCATFCIACHTLQSCRTEPLSKLRA